MKKFIIGLFVFGLVGCAGIQLEGIKYKLANGKVASCIPHPEREGFMRCAYMDGEQEIVFAIKQNMISGR